MRKYFLLLAGLVALTACQKEVPSLTFPLTMDSAIEVAGEYINRYPDRDWFASKNIIEPGTVLQYSEFGIRYDTPELLHDYTSPDFRAWLVVIITDRKPWSPDPRGNLHLFIDADTGRCSEVWLDGQAIVEWGSTPASHTN